MNELTVITRRIEFDAGHRIPSHKSKCRNLHGHRYVLEATVRGPINPQRGQSDDGMIVDFGDLKTIMVSEVGDPWDHAFLVYEGDKPVVGLLGQLSSVINGQGGTTDFVHKTVVLDVVPTVENLVGVAFSKIDAALRGLNSPFTLACVRLYETPNCWADKIVDQ